MNTNFKKHGRSTFAGALGGIAAYMASTGVAWAMSKDGEESNEQESTPLETLQFETEAGTVTLEDLNGDGVYDPVVVEVSEPAISISDEDPTSAQLAINTSDSMSFSEAFASAREEVGAGGIFVWQGNSYGTYYKEEWESMSDDDQNNYWASVHESEQQNEYLASLNQNNEESTDPILVNNEIPENEVASASLETELQASDPIEMDINEDGINDSVLIDSDEDGVHDTLLTDSNNDGQLDTMVVDSDGDGQLDSYGIDTDGDGQFDETGTLFEQEDNTLASNDDFGSDYDNNADVSDMI